MTKRENNAIRFLRLMSDGRWHTNGSLAKVCGYRFGARKWELVKAYGIDIEKRTIGEDQYEYRWRDSEAKKAIVLSAVERGEAPPPVEPKQLSLLA